MVNSHCQGLRNARLGSGLGVDFVVGHNKPLSVPCSLAG